MCFYFMTSHFFKKEEKELLKHVTLVCSGFAILTLLIILCFYDLKESHPNLKLEHNNMRF